MKGKDFTACCGIYCPDCIWYRNRFSALAKKLKEELQHADFEQYASIESPFFGKELVKFQKFMTVLNFIADIYCSKPCRVGGGCAGNPCEIMRCAEEKGLEGCWLCGEMDDCDHLTKDDD